MGELLYGSELSEKLKGEMREMVKQYEKEGRRLPRLDTIVAGDDPASLSYIKGKKKACEFVGIRNVVHQLPSTVSQRELEQLIRSCNNDEMCDGILLQMPLPEGLDANAAILAIDPDKDVDGLHPLNVGRLYAGEPCFAPCTPVGIMLILEAMGCPIDGMRAVVIGRSRLVGNPVARLLQDRNATVTICHSHTRNLAEITKACDIVVAACGQPQLIDHTYIKEGAYVVDVGINRKADGHLCGDVNTDDVLPYVRYVTPVPKGVGPMTICSLLHNTLKAYEKRCLR